MYINVGTKKENKMVLNDIKRDIEIRCEVEGTTKAQAAYNVGMTRQYVSRFWTEVKMVNENYIKFMEGLGYDIELTYVKRKGR